MSAQGRVDRARERLESAQNVAATDSAIRIVKLNPPLAGAAPVHLKRRITVIQRLSDSGKRTLFSTIAGMRRDVEDLTEQDYSSDDELSSEIASQLADVVDSCEQAILLAGAEMRGADMALSDLDEQIRTSPEAPEIAFVAPPPEFADFVSQVEDSPAEADSIRSGLKALDEDPRRVALAAACSLDLANPGADLEPHGTRLFGSSNRLNTNVFQAEAEGALSEYDMSPGSPAYVLSSRLNYVGISTTPLEAADTAQRLLAEIDRVFEQRVEFETTLQSATGQAGELVAQRNQILARRSATERKVATQRQLLSLAQAQLRNGGGHKPRGLMPVLLEEPFTDLPTELTNETLSMLLRHSEAAQVLLVTERRDVASWCNAVGGPDAGTVEVTGWFAHEHSEW